MYGLATPTKSKLHMPADFRYLPEEMSWNRGLKVGREGCQIDGGGERGNDRGEKKGRLYPKKDRTKWWQYQILNPGLSCCVSVGAVPNCPAMATGAYPGAMGKILYTLTRELQQPKSLLGDTMETILASLHQCEEIYVGLAY